MYDEDEFLSGELGPRPDPEQIEGLSPDPGWRRADSVTRARAVRITPSMLLAAMVGVMIVAAIELHASVGRPTRPVQSRRPGLAGAKAARLTRRTVRVNPGRSPQRSGTRVHHAPRPATRRPEPVAAGTHRAIAPGGTAARPAAAVLSGAEFGFER